MSTPVPIRFSDEEREHLREMAESQGVTVSEVVRAALDRYYKLYKAKGALTDALRGEKRVLQPCTTKDVAQPITFDKPDVVQPVVQERGVGWTD